MHAAIAAQSYQTRVLTQLAPEQQGNTLPEYWHRSATAIHAQQHSFEMDFENTLLNIRFS